MDIKQLEYVLAIANAGTIGRAAKQVGLTQQALSKSLSRFEANHGGMLFERTPQGMTLTRLGKVVCEHARDVIATHGRMQAAIASELDLERGRLVIGLSPIAATSRAGQVLTAFAAQNPNLRIDIEAGIDVGFSRALNLGLIDLAIATNSEQSSQEHLREIIGHEVWGVVGRKHHPVLSNAQSIVELENVSWIIGRNTDMLRESIDSFFRNASRTPPRPGIMTTSVLYALSALENSEKLAILPRSLCVRNPNLLWKDLSKGKWETPIYLMRRRQAHLSPLARRLIELLVDM